MRKLSIVLTALLVLAGSCWAQQEVNERRQADPSGVVEIENVAGSVEVVGWGQAELVVTGTLGRGTERLDVDGDGHRIRIKVVLPRDARNVDGSDLTIRVPAGSRVEVSTVSADIHVAGLEGRVDLQSVSGSILVGGTPAELEAETVSGELDVERAPDRSELASVSGDVTVTWAEGAIEAASVSGDVIIRDGSLDRAELATTSGNVRCEAEVTGRGSFDMETMSGNVVMVVPAGVAAEFEISTFSGSIRSQLGPEPQRTNRYAPGEELNFSTGAGGPRISLSSFSGNVELRTR